MKKYGNRLFTMIELITASMLMLIIFLMVGLVFSTVVSTSSTVKDKITEALMVNRFFDKLATDLQCAYPVFYLGINSDDNFVNSSYTATTNPHIDLGANFQNGGLTTKPLTPTGSEHREFLRFVSTIQRIGGYQRWSGSSLIGTSANFKDRPVRFISYNYTGQNPYAKGIIKEYSIYRREIFMRPDAKKAKSLMAPYAIEGAKVKVFEYPDVDEELVEDLLLRDVYEVRVEAVERTVNKSLKGGLEGKFGNKVAYKVSIEFAQVDVTKSYGDMTRYSRYSNLDLDGNGQKDRLDHTYTTVIVVHKNNVD